MKKYIEPEIVMMEIEESDIIATSDPNSAINQQSSNDDMAKERQTVDFSDSESIW